MKDFEGFFKEFKKQQNIMLYLLIFSMLLSSGLMYLFGDVISKYISGYTVPDYIHLYIFTIIVIIMCIIHFFLEKIKLLGFMFLFSTLILLFSMSVAVFFFKDFNTIVLFVMTFVVFIFLIVILRFFKIVIDMSKEV